MLIHNILLHNIKIQSRFYLVVNNSDLTYSVGESVSAQPIQAMGGSGNFTYSITPSLPSGLSFNTSTGFITGTPSSTLSLTSFTVTVVDNEE